MRRLLAAVCSATLLASVVPATRFGTVPGVNGHAPLPAPAASP